MRNFNSIASLIARNLLPQALKLSLSLSSPSISHQTYAVFLKSGHELDSSLSTSLVTHFSNSGDFSGAFRVLLDTHQPSIFSFNALLSGYARLHRSSCCFSLYNRILRYGLRPDRYTLSLLIKLCDDVQKIGVVHCVCVKLGFNLSGFLGCGLVNKYGKFGRIDSAEKCFEECLDVDGVVWTSMINGYVWNGEIERAREVFMGGIRDLGFELNEFSLTAVVGALREVKEVEQIHGFALKNGLVCKGSIHLSNAMMNMYCKCGSKVDALKVFDEMPDPDVVSWTARIGAASSGGEALEAFRFMHSNNLEANELTIINVLSAIDNPGLLMSGRQLHCLCQKAGYMNVTSVSNVLISMYGKCSQVRDAELVFDDLWFRDSVSWNSLILVYSENGLVSSAVKTFSRMREFGVDPNQYTLGSILGSVAGPSFSDIVMQMHSLMTKTGLTSDHTMISCLISSYGKCDLLNYARRMFSNTGHLQVMVATAVTAGCPEEALECCKSVVSSWSEIDVVTLCIVLKACSSLTNLGLGRAVHCLIMKSGVGSDRFVETAIVDFYCKSGSIADAQNTFVDLSNHHNLAAWNAMIMGYAQHGFYFEVLDLFSKMTELSINPDEITYLGILQACCHVGLVKEADFHLSSMFELHGVVPCLEHYACLIDLLGRVGLIKEAKLLIDQMPVSPDAHIWQSLLSACNNFGNLELGEFAAGELLKLQPENESAYILMSNLYAKAGDWDAVRRMRKEMKEKLIYKEPGSSWIEVGGTVCHFVAEDLSHPDNGLIYFHLQCLAKQMRPLFDTEEDFPCFS